MDDVGDVGRVERGADRPQVRDVALDDVDGGELVGGHDLGQAPRVGPEVERRHGRPLADQRPDRPGADAAHRARDEEPRPRAAHETAAGAELSTCPLAIRSWRHALRSRPMPSIDTVTTSPSRRTTGRVAEDADAARRAGRDDVAGLQRERHRAVADDLGDAEVHLRGARVLEDLVVDPALDLERLRIGDLVGRHEGRAHRAEGVERLATRPLAVAELEVARRDVVEGGVAEDVLEGVGGRHAAGGSSDDDGELGLVVDLRRQRGSQRISASGPTIELGHLAKIRGAGGVSTPSSSACSR